MALENKKHTKFYTTDGSNADKVSTAKLAYVKDLWDKDVASGSNLNLLEDPTLGPLLYQMQQMQDELDSIRTHIVNDIGDGAQGPQGPAGAKGDTGDAGADGSNGSNGSNGNTGSRGPTGNTGSAGAAGPAGGVYGNLIKILPTQFMGNDDVNYERTTIEDDIRGKLGVRVTNSSQEIFASVTIPEGKKVTGYAVYASSKVTTYLNGVDLSSGVSSEIGTGFSGAVINLKTEYNSAETNYVAIKVMTTSTGQVIYGGVIVIADR